jgi:mRNA interferase MazF
MAFQRGDVVLIPFPFTDLSASKTRPAVVVSSDLYHQTRPELLLAYVSSQVSKAQPALDYLLVDWTTAGLPRPSFIRPKIAAIEPALIVHQVGRLSERDLLEADRRLRRAMALTATALLDVVSDVDLMTQPASVVQALAEKSLTAVAAFAETGSPEVAVQRLVDLLRTPRGGEPS